LDTTEQILIEQIKRGDKHAVEVIFKAYYRPLCGYANKILTDIDVAEEIVQEMFFQLWQKREDLPVIVSLKSYLYRSVHNACLNDIKHKKVEQKHSDHVHYVQENNVEDFVDLAETTELQEKIRIAIDKLPTERKKIFIMIRYEELKYSEVAEKLGISIKTVENQMGSALKLMRQELKDYLPIILFILVGLLQFSLHCHRGFCLLNFHV
jgi:RNA polymerase sigma-70 factor (ECF subfamily)